MSMPEARKRALRRALLDWYASHRRDLPWRRSSDPYAVWVSEMMLQQTRVETVRPYFERWMRRFPSVDALANATEDEVLHAWQGLGYYARARNLLSGARAVAERHHGRVPANLEELLALPGIGRYSAGAIASIAHKKPVPIVDGNVVRVLCRLEALPGNPARAPLQAKLWKLAEELVPKQRPADFNQAMMELGALVCRAKNPECSRCPVSRWCRARERGTVDRLPEIAKRPAPTPVSMVAAVIWRRGRVLVGQLDARAARWRGMWQFPCSELDDGADPERAVELTSRESVGLDVQVGGLVTSVRHSVTRYRITLDAYRCVAGRGRPRPIGFREVSWKRPGELEALALPAAHRRIARQLA